MSSPTMTEIKEVFFKAMRAGYATNPPKTTIEELPGSKVITFKEGDWLVKDVYYVNKDSGQSFGTTIIWHQGQPVWFMNYYGWYSDRGAEFLKEVLRDAYRRGEWYGGRGQSGQTSSRRDVYTNVRTMHDFDKFCGEEVIVGTFGENLGWHTYEGGRVNSPNRITPP